MNPYNCFLKRNKTVLNEAQANYREIEKYLERFKPFKGNSAYAIFKDPYYIVYSYKTEILKYDTEDRKVVYFDDKKYSSTTSRLQNLIKKIFWYELEKYKPMNESKVDTLSNLKKQIEKTGVEEFIQLANKVETAVKLSKNKDAYTLSAKLDKLADYANATVEAEKAAVDEVDPAFARAASLLQKMFKIANGKNINESVDVNDVLDDCRGYLKEVYKAKRHLEGEESSEEIYDQIDEYNIVIDSMEDIISDLESDEPNVDLIKDEYLDVLKNNHLDANISSNHRITSFCDDAILAVDRFVAAVEEYLHY